MNDEGKKELDLSGTSRKSFFDASKERGEETFASLKFDSKDNVHVKRAFGLALDKLRHQLPYETTTNQSIQAELDRAKKVLGYEVRLLHTEVFNAAGYIPWLKRNFSREGEAAINAFQQPVGNNDITDTRLKDLILRETIWILAEQIRHCPQRINCLFYKHRSQLQSWYTSDTNNLVNWFLHHRDSDIHVAVSNLHPPTVDINMVRDGIDKFINAELNFDDIDDCGRWNENTFFKTFVEIPGGTLFFVILKYMTGTIIFKLWTVALLLFLYKFQAIIPKVDDMIGNPKYYEIPALRGFVLLDFGVLVILTLNEWILRFVMVRQRLFQNMSGWLRARVFIGLLQPIFGVVGFFGVMYGFPSVNKDWAATIDYMGAYYLAMRLGLSVLPEFFPFSPMLETASQKNKFWAWKGLRKRYIARIVFMIILVGVSMIYEFLLIIPAIDTLFKTVYCGDAQFTYDITIKDSNLGQNSLLGINTQHLICIFSSAFMWFVTLVAVLIDNGLAFITVMAFVGWIRGFKTQGTARATIQIDSKELFKHLSERFIHKPKLNARNRPTPRLRKISLPEHTLEDATASMGNLGNGGSPTKKSNPDRRLSTIDNTDMKVIPLDGSHSIPIIPRPTNHRKSTTINSVGTTSNPTSYNSPSLASGSLLNSSNGPIPSPKPDIVVTNATSASTSATTTATTTATTNAATSTAKNIAATSSMKERPSGDPAKDLWSWAVDYYRGLDLISDKEVEYLKTSQILDMAYLGSPDAQKHLSFFVNTLDVPPVLNYPFHEILPTTIIIPVYSERLEFKWSPEKNYSPHAEFAHLVAKYPHEWLNLIERMKREKRIDTEHEELECWITSQRDLTEADARIVRPVTDWLTNHDQYVEKTVRGAASYYDALVQLGIREAGLSEAHAKVFAKEKLQVIVCVQTYQSRYKEVAATLNRWMKEIPCLNIVFDFDRAAFDKKGEHLTAEEFQIPKDYAFATCLLQYDPFLGKVVLRHTIPRKYPLRLADKNNNAIQGKSMNQLYGMTFLYGRFIQVLDANQGGHAPEYLKFPSLLRDFRLHTQTGDIRYRIIGSREYIFTKNLGNVARCHAYQEWSFGTLVLRTYSDLGIRLHYGHPDVFHGPWAYAHSGLSKVNPDINTSEDVFAGFGTMLCNENTKHVEHIQFHKGRETGLASMSMFDTKISQGNSGILRSRDMYHLMERLDSVTGFLLFQGVAGHFTTISLMMWSMKLYIMCIFLGVLSGASLKAFGNITYSNEWLFHAGLTTIIPLVVEFLVEYGPVIGLLRTVIFLPASTMIYLFQMQTKHHAFLKGILTGKASHLNTGRGLAIYRTPMIDLFRNYANTHVFPIFYVVGLTIAYKSQSTDLGGGTLPLIMIYFLCASVLLVPQLFNPAITGNTLREVGIDFVNYLSWIGKSETRRFLKDWATPAQQKLEGAFLTFWINIDYDTLPQSTAAAGRSLAYHILIIIFWTGVSVFLVYPLMQFWVVFYLCFWWLNTILYMIIFYILKEYEAPLRIILIYIGCGAGVAYFLVTWGDYGVLQFSEMYIAFLLFVKVLESWRALLCDMAVLLSFMKAKGKEKDEREKYVAFILHILNKLFLVNFARVCLALLWGILNFIVALLMRPYIANLFLFGDNMNTKHFGYLKPLRKLRARQMKFGINI